MDEILNFLSIVGVSAISVAVRLANAAAAQLGKETVDESAIVYPTGQRAEARY